MCCVGGLCGWCECCVVCVWRGSGLCWGGGSPPPTHPHQPTPHTLAAAGLRPGWRTAASPPARCTRRLRGTRGSAAQQNPPIGSSLSCCGGTTLGAFGGGAWGRSGGGGCVCQAARASVRVHMSQSTNPTPPPPPTHPCRLFALKHGSRIFHLHGTAGSGRGGAPWRRDAAAFERWREGRTGWPLVDANMRELKATGGCVWGGRGGGLAGLAQRCREWALCECVRVGWHGRPPPCPHPPSTPPSHQAL